MALIPEVTKIMPDANNVKFRLKLTDGTDVVIDKVYPSQYNPTTGPTSENETATKKDMQADIDAYKALKATFDRPAYATAAESIQSGLEM